MSPSKIAGAVIALATFVQIPDASACGGFFCGRLPVDQTAERILFEIGDGSVTMTTQISFNGDAADFAWVLPLNAVPDPDSLAVFPQRALTGLDANSGPVFYEPCAVFEAAGAGNSSTDGGVPTPEPPVTVHIRAEVGDYDVAVIESEDPDALIEWLRTEGFRVTAPMEPYVDLYTSEGMKFLALKLLDTADVSDIKPFRFTLPGDAPSIPLRMTSLAAEPEMSIVVFILGDQRYEAKNWMNITVDDSLLRFQPYTYPLKTNWPVLVAQGVDAAGGQGWVTEFAGSTESYLSLLDSQITSDNFATEEDREAAHALLDAIEPHPYLTRLYSRLSAEEMTSDPVFGRSAGGDVSQYHELENMIDGVDQCSFNDPSESPCDFVTCGAGGTCRTAQVDDGSGQMVTVAGCACVPGATARTTFAPDGTATVICQDLRMSFLNPGDQEAGGETLPDTCATFDCGNHGSCSPVNLTPTCVCDQGYIGVGSFTADGTRQTTCVAPDTEIETTFYDGRLPALPADMPGGRAVELPEGSAGTSATGGSGGSSNSTSTDGSSSGGSSSVPATTGGSDGPDASGDSDDSGSGGGCSVGGHPARLPASWLSVALAGWWLGRRRRSQPSRARR